MVARPPPAATGRSFASLLQLLPACCSCLTHVSSQGVSKLQISFYFRVFFLVALIMASGHFLGCIWLMLGRHNVLQQINPEGW